MKRRLADLPLHTGSAPPWLFQRMWKLAGAITMAVVDEYGPAEMLRRLSDPWWFQAFGCVLGFDWHSSGVTTVTCGAMKEAYKRFGNDLGILVAGGKGATSRKTPTEITQISDALAITQGTDLVRASKLSAKVDSAALQDGFDLYHHSFFFTPKGEWCVVQQGMSDATHYARRYHWLGEGVNDFACEPHNAVQDLASPPRKRRGSDDGQLLLNMVAGEAEANRNASVELIGWNPDKLIVEIHKLTDGPTLFAPSHHAVLPADVNLDRLSRIVRTAHESNPQDFITLLGQQGVGARTVRALSLVAELIYDAPASHRDPATPRVPAHRAAAAPVGRLLLRPRRQRPPPLPRGPRNLRQVHRRPYRRRPQGAGGGDREGRGAEALGPKHLSEPPPSRGARKSVDAQLRFVNNLTTCHC